MTDDTKAWVQAIVGGVIAAGIWEGIAHSWQISTALWIPILIFVTFTLSSLLSGWLIGRRKVQRVRTYCSILHDIIKEQHAGLEGGDRGALEKAVSKFFGILCDSTTLNHVHGGVIFSVDNKDPQWLVTTMFSAKKGRSAKKFFVGHQNGGAQEGSAPGAAGTAFLQNSPLIVRFGLKGRPDNRMYHQFHLKPTSTYRSFIVSPIRWKDKPIGVLSLESTIRNGFAEGEKIWYQLIADQLAVILYNIGKLDASAAHAPALAE